MKKLIPLILMAALCSGCGTLTQNLKMSLLCNVADTSAAFAITAGLTTPKQILDTVPRVREIINDKTVIADIVADIESDLPECPVLDAIVKALGAELFSVQASLTGMRRIRIENILVGWERRAQLWIIRGRITGADDG